MQDAGFTGAVLDAHDPRTLYLLVEHGSGRGACNVLDPAAVVTAQDATSVTVAVRGGMAFPASAPATGYVGFSCSLTGYAQVPVRLDAPLGNRALYSGTDKHAQPVLDPATVPVPSDVPPGYTAEPVTWEPDHMPATPSAATVGGRGANWPALRRYRDGADVLDVRVGRPAIFVDPDATVRDHVTMARHPAAVSGYDGTLCVTWTETATHAVQVCSTAEARPASGASGEVTQPVSAPLSEQQLLQVAGSLG